jgi:short-subunit dehydrogenase
MKYYSNKNVLVTGAASGLGKELAILLASYSANLVLIDINKEQLKLVHSLCEEHGVTVHSFTINLLDQTGLADIKESIGLPDIIIANAGIGGVNPGYHFDQNIDSKIMGLNYHGLVRTIAPFLEDFVLRKSGQICGVSSLASMKGLPGGSSYSASKAAVNNYLESIRMDLRPHNIYVTTVLPGFIKTAMTDHDAFEMPFMQSPTSSARNILKAISKRKRIYAFPKIMYWGTLLNRLMPSFIYDFMMTKISGQSNDLKPRIF